MACKMMITFIKIFLIIQINSSLSAKSYRDQFKTVCGRKNVLKRIVGGTDALKGEFPFFARIGSITVMDQVYYYCGASLITDRHVLSADHCYDYPAKEQELDRLVVRLGPQDGKNETTDPNLYSVDKLIPYYVNATAFHNDIALLVLEKKVKFTGLIYPICLPDHITPNSLIGEDVTVIGFGLIDSVKETEPDILQKTTVTIKKLTDCNEIFQGPWRKGKMCAGSKIKDSCSGDSGGPLFKLLETNGVSRFTQIGIVSYGSPVCEDESPAVYTDINYFLKWIDSFMRI